MNKCLLFYFLFFAYFSTSAQYVVNVNKLGATISPTMWGLFFEDINRSGDGGMYADLVKNRSFDFPEAFMGWSTEPSRRIYARNDVFQIIHRGEKNGNNPKYLQVTIRNPEKILLVNEGFGGIAVKKGLTYELILLIREPKRGIRIKADIINAANRSVGSVSLNLTGEAGWWTIKTELTSSDTTNNGKLLLSFEGMGQVDIDRISLFPADTWKQRKEGLRSDLAQKLVEIQPGFMRFPGGCIVEGDNIAARYQWKHTIGPIEERKLNSNQWSSGGASGRAMGDYFQSYGLGFLEYFQLCEDIRAEPMPILNCGLSCQFGAGEVVALDEMDPYVQDAIDLIEFANGDATTTWGRKRVQLGHEAPFNLKMLGIGNENWGPQYLERLELFTKAIKAKYPYVQLIASTGYSPNPQFKYMDSALRHNQVDIIDEHYYQRPNWFLMNAGKYDHYDRRGPKIFIGEYACHSVRIGSTENKNTLYCALAEAAFMTGLERNADIVTMAAYAPLFAHVKNWQWTPNLIWFDNTTSYATPSYYVQKMISVNKGTHVVPITENNNTIAGIDSIWASAVIDTITRELILKVVNPSGESKTKDVIVDAGKVAASASLTVLKSDNPQAVNSLESPSTVTPVTTSLSIKGKKLSLSIAPYSFNVIRVKVKVK